ncbi:MAG TPA: LptE family protein [Bacteroidia bacterium]|nr:LptE family protein [Bacteroidia bacterium]
MSYSFNGASVPADAKTISIQYFQNYAPLAGPTISQLFTEELKNYFSQQTHLSLVDKGGDLNFEGSITGFSTAPLAIKPGDQSALTRLTVTVQVKYTNKFDKTKNFDASFSRFADYTSSQNLSTVENDLVTQINQQLAEDIFNKALNNW